MPDQRWIQTDSCRIEINIFHILNRNKMEVFGIF